MFPRKINAITCFTASALPLFSTFAWAAPPDTPANLSTLGLSGQQIGPNELRYIRGGFELSPSLSISFAFKQIQAVNGIIVKSIMVPETNITPTAVPSLSGSNTSPAVTVTDAAGSTQTVTPSSNGNITVSSTTNNGQTTIGTQLGSNGLATVTENQANNASVSVASTINIAISGMSQFLTRQQSFANMQSGLYYAGSAFK